MLDKNPKQILDNNLVQILNEFSSKNPNIILCSEPFMKSQFLNELIDSVDLHVIFLDFDLLYTGYVVSEMLEKNTRVEIYHPKKDNLEEIFSEIAKKVSVKKYLVILDSFNGLYNLFTEIESGIFVNTIIMLLASIASQKNSIIVVSAMARKMKNGGWVLSPGGRHIINSTNSGIYYVNSEGKSLILKSLNYDGSLKIFRIDLM
ncbi:MAG: ELP5 family protein [Nitrosopumilus sp.]|nr:ELP5 family protein [Nitrosopumilus sp.]